VLFLGHLLGFHSLRGVQVVLFLALLGFLAADLVVSLRPTALRLLVLGYETLDLRVGLLVIR